jgi:hypothetical protein
MAPKTSNQIIADAHAALERNRLQEKVSQNKQFLYEMDEAGWKQLFEAAGKTFSDKKAGQSILDVAGSLRRRWNDDNAKLVAFADRVQGDLGQALFADLLMRAFDGKQKKPEKLGRDLNRFPDKLRDAETRVYESLHRDFATAEQVQAVSTQQPPRDTGGRPRKWDKLWQVIQEQDAKKPKPIDQGIAGTYNKQYGNPDCHQPKATAAIVARVRYDRKNRKCKQNPK